MAFMNVGLSTLGMDKMSRFKVLKPHIIAFIKHMTLKKINNFIRAEINRILKRKVLNSYPYILKIESTNICNLKCGFCYNSRRTPRTGERAYGRMSFENFKKIVDEVGPYLFKINLYGFGEPLLFDETFDMVKYATQNNIGVGISSNMNINRPDLTQKIIDSGLEVLIFSCHGATQKSYSRFMGKGSMNLALNNIKALIKEQRRLKLKTPLTDWQFCVTRFNEDEIPLAEKKAKEIGINQIRFLIPDLPEKAESEWFSNLFPKRSDVLKDAVGCSWVYRSAYINYDGGLLPCCRDTRLLTNDFGNVFRDGFMNIWNNQKYQGSRELIANPTQPVKCKIMCQKCPAAGFKER
jgi:MoaA/NifB/PqqE/SkfB family radical SAM enzyme